MHLHLTHLSREQTPLLLPESPYLSSLLYYYYSFPSSTGYSLCGLSLCKVKDFIMEIVPDYEYYRSGHHQRMEIVPKTQYSSDRLHQSGMDIRSVADIDGELARVESRELRRNIEAWVRMEKTKGENKAIKKRSKLEAWEIEMKADARERFERKRAEWFEKLQNELAEIDTYVAGERAMIDAEQEKNNLKINNKAAKYLSQGYLPKKFLSFFRFRG